jgi:hypothetical protein
MEGYFDTVVNFWIPQKEAFFLDQLNDYQLPEDSGSVRMVIRLEPI